MDGLKYFKKGGSIFCDLTGIKEINVKIRADKGFLIA